MRFGGKTTVRNYKYRLMAPYAVVFVALSTVGYQLINSSSAAPLEQGSIVLSTGKAQYSYGEAVKFTIINRTTTTVSIINNCPAEPLEVYRLVDGRWTRIHDSVNASKCLNEPRSYGIAAGASVSATYRYWPGLFIVPGQYRLVAPIESYPNSPSVEFTVAPQ